MKRSSSLEFRNNVRMFLSVPEHFFSKSQGQSAVLLFSLVGNFCPKICQDFQNNIGTCVVLLRLTIKDSTVLCVISLLVPVVECCCRLLQ